jgi:hypothetical protein
LSADLSADLSAEALAKAEALAEAEALAKAEVLAKVGARLARRLGGGGDSGVRARSCALHAWRVRPFGRTDYRILRWHQPRHLIERVPRVDV